MSFARAFLVTLLLALLAAPAAAAGVRMAARDESVGAVSAGGVQRAPFRFNMVGLHWRGTGGVSFRTRSSRGPWSVWQAARPETEDLPDTGSPEAATTRGWKLGNPYWTGPADVIQYRLGGDVTELRTYFLWSDPEAETVRTVARAAKPAIISRAQWGADESIVRAPPYYADRLRFAVVHHTAGTNSYSASESAAIVRGIQRYHVLANGWNDIGYNFLVDKYGQVFAGRGGGIARNVVGAHAQGFNTGSTGVAVLGTYTSRRVSRAARAALVKLLAWRLDVAHVDPLTRLTWISGGNPRYPAGTAVRLRAISGHRDTGPTTCPGDALYAQLPGIASSVAARGLPKLYDPEVAGELGGPVRVTGRLSTSLPWTVAIRDADGVRVARGKGSGRAVDWTWDASATPFGRFTSTIAAGSGVRPWTDSIPGPPRLVVRRLDAAPGALTPNDDGSGERTTISFALTTAATVTVDVVDDSGARIRRLVSARSLPRGKSRLAWAGREDDGTWTPDGRYSVRVRATSPGQSASSSTGIVVDRTLGHLVVSPNPFSPNRDGRLDTTTAGFELTRKADVRVRVFHGGTRVATLAVATLASGAHSYPWNGADRDGNRVADGRYRILVSATTTTLGTRVLRKRVRVDTIRPAIRFERAFFRDGRTFVRFWLSEPMRLRIWYGSPSWSDGLWRDVKRDAGYGHVSVPGRVAEVRLRGRDAAQNRSRAAVVALG